jgi:hypothetical protein
MEERQQQQQEPQTTVEVAVPNTRCPECSHALRKMKDPLICTKCGRAYHIKCAKETRDTLRVLRTNRTWTCHFCAQLTAGSPEPAPRTPLETVGGGSTRKVGGLSILQWNCDGLATKKDELQELLSREGVDVLLLQETKLGERDSTPAILGYSAVRRDRAGSGTARPRGGGLCCYVRDGVPFWPEDFHTTSPAEVQVVCVPASRTVTLRIANLYFPPSRDAGERRRWQAALGDIGRLPRGRDVLWCGDFNAHHATWDPHIAEDSRGETLEEKLTELSLLPINDGSPTRFSRSEAGGTCSAPDLTVASVGQVDDYQWEVLHELSSDHLPIRVKWRKEVQVCDGGRAVEPNVRKADWQQYRATIEEGIGEVQREESPGTKLGLLAALMLRALRAAAPAKVRRPHTTPWMTADIKRLKGERNRLRRDLTNRREEWVQKCRELKERIVEEKRKVWRKKLDEVMESKDIGKAWEIVKSLNGARRPEEGKALEYRGRRCTTPRAKANAFVQEYAEVSGRSSTKETRKEAVRLARLLRRTHTAPRQELEGEFTAGELTRALSKVKFGKAAGPDGIRSDLVKRLPVSAVTELLAICNASWTTLWIPQEWRRATIHPVLKKGKDPAQIGSYRPIALTSHIGKLMERLVATRLSWWLESRDALSPFQAGFRKGRSTLDQCLRLSQRINDGFQAGKPERALVTLFDYSRAFDTVRRSGLLTKMETLGIPVTFIRWIKEWLVNRIARAKVGEERSRSRVFREGLPQGAVLSPILFVIFIDDLLCQFDESTLVSAFADDLALATFSVKKEQAAAAMQREIVTVQEWSAAWGLKLNVGKCEACLFTTSTAEHEWSPGLVLNGQQVRDTKHPVFLGITYDKQLTFGPHARKVAGRMGERTSILKAIGGATWGWSKKSLREVYVATQRSLAEYASPAWAPWMSKTSSAGHHRGGQKHPDGGRAARGGAGTSRYAPRESCTRHAGSVETPT